MGDLSSTSTRTITITPLAAEDLKDHRHHKDRLGAKIRQLETGADQRGIPLGPPLQGYRRLRMDDLRIVYRCRPTTVEVIAIGPRKDKKVYKIAADRLPPQNL